MVLAYFIYKIVFDDKIDCEYYYDNCIYNCEEIGQIPVFEVYDITAKLGMMYIGIVKYFNLLLSSKC